MDKVSLILSALISVAFVLMLAPGVLAMNRGKALRNLAMWVAIFLGLALLYRTVGPGRPAGSPLTVMESSDSGASSDLQTPADQDPSPDVPDGNADYTPPRE